MKIRKATNLELQMFTPVAMPANAENTGNFVTADNGRKGLLIEFENGNFALHLGQGVYQRVNTEDVIAAHPVSWGGKRKGAGRKESGNREEKSIARFTVTKKEKEEIKKLLKKLRIPNADKILGTLKER